MAIPIRCSIWVLSKHMKKKKKKPTQIKINFRFRIKASRFQFFNLFLPFLKDQIVQSVEFGIETKN